MPTTQGNVLTQLLLTKHQHKAENLWALKTVMSHFSYNSATDITDVFMAMFPDSAFAQKMNCGPTKLSYLICFGIAPYFPTSGYFATLRSAIQGDIIVAKLHFFASTASVMMQYLQKFQGEAPLLPFTATEVTVMLETLMQKFIKQSEMQAANSAVKIAKLNVMETSIHLAPSDVDVGFAAAATLSKFIKEKKLSQQQVFEFKKSVVQCW